MENENVETEVAGLPSRPLTCSTRRYQVLPLSKSYHCCFEATVIDTEKLEYKTSKGESVFESVCECFSVEDAQKVADALNQV